MARLAYTFKTDFLFKTLFVQYPDLLKKLVSELLGIRIESIGQFIIANPEMPPENLGDKFCRIRIPRERTPRLIYQGIKRFVDDKTRFSS